VQIETIPVDACVHLFDKVTGINHDLKTGSYTCLINDTTFHARFILSICASSISTDVTIQEKILPNSITILNDESGAIVNLDFAEKTKATISVRNIFGQHILNDMTVFVTKKSIPVNLNQMNQVLLITVTTEKESISKKIIR
jgi:hypothetical protein